MSLESLTRRSIQFGLIYVVIISIGCFLWYRYSISEAKKEQHHHKLSIKEVITKIEDGNLKYQNAKTVDNMLPSDIANTKEKSTKVSDPEFTSNLNVNTPIDSHNNANIPTVSPHGLGPFPEIPDGWSKTSFASDMTIGQELIQRVRLELFKQGIYTYGGSIDNKTGLVYPIVKNEVFITWGTARFPVIGIQKYATTITGYPETINRIEENVRLRESPIPYQIRQITEIDIPSDVVVKSRSEGIDPYKFLNLTAVTNINEDTK
ncbi:hypothetical protein C6497_12295 [Candidatus Poribacteria bacterium]|nr:MAG: hypothetical protein C6497_12295 [Candidatus Poribacteria bacterium]